MSPKQNARARFRHAVTREHGLVMLVTLLVLMMMTSTALFAMHTSSLELRASGHSRRAMQAEYVSEGTARTAMAVVATMGSETLLYKLRRDRELAGGSGQPRNAGARSHLRLEPVRRGSPDRGGLHAPRSPDPQDQLGPHESGDAVRWVDVNDVYVTQLNRAGERSGDGAPAVMMHIVYTARARLRPNASIVTGGVEADTAAIDFGFHAGETAAGTRIFALQTDYPAGRL
ncbi:MAG: hypothetical protein IPG17_08105 [Sandaracinaceae bacterium]|nr:hypothetical protein [Sandaracinaceae bacterium]